MALVITDGDSSEDEVFVGKLTIKEIKKHIFMDRPRNTYLCHEQKLSLDTYNVVPVNEENSLKIIESQSQPNLNASFQNRLSGNGLYEMEEFAKESGLREKFNNTFEFVDYILNNEPSNQEEYTSINLGEKEKESTERDIDYAPNIVLSSITKTSKNQETPNSNKDKNVGSTSSSKKDNHILDIEVFETPLTNMKSTSGLEVNNLNKETHRMNCNNQSLTINLNDNLPSVHRSSEDSFLQMEELVNKLCAPAKELDSGEKFNNTFELVDYILNKNTGNKNEHKTLKADESIKIENDMLKTLEKLHVNDAIEKDNRLEKVCKLNIQKTPNAKGTFHAIKNLSAKKETKFIENDVFKTPSSSMKMKRLFTTPASSSHSNKKDLATFVKKSQLSAPKFKSVMSPVAAHINLKPPASKILNAHPKKVSTLVFQPNRHSSKTANKENKDLNPLCYKSAKQTKMIDPPNIAKLPKSCQKTSIPKFTTLHHIHREITPNNIKSAKVDNSFGNISYQQAELSVCVRNSAFTIKK